MSTSVQLCYNTLCLFNAASTAIIQQTPVPPAEILLQAGLLLSSRLPLSVLLLDALQLLDELPAALQLDCYAKPLATALPSLISLHYSCVMFSYIAAGTPPPASPPELPDNSLLAAVISDQLPTTRAFLQHLLDTNYQSK